MALPIRTMPGFLSPVAGTGVGEGAAGEAIAAGMATVGAWPGRALAADNPCPWAARLWAATFWAAALCSIICVCAVPSAVEAAEEPLFESRYCINIWFCAAVKDVAPPFCCAASSCISACAWASEMMVAAFDVLCAERGEGQTGISNTAANPGNINLLELRRIMPISLFWGDMGEFGVPTLRWRLELAASLSRARH